LSEDENLQTVIEADLQSINKLFGSKENLAELIEDAMNEADKALGTKLNIECPCEFRGNQ